MKKIRPDRSHNSALFYKKLYISIGASGDLNKNIDENVKISEEGKKKHIVGHIMASLTEKQ